MTELTILQFQVDAFASQPFEGNPAAVCVLGKWPDDAFLQALAEENNLSETAYLVPARDHYELRWFTPAREVDLCGHATLASAHILFEQLDYPTDCIQFETRSGVLKVWRDGDQLVMDFPALPPVPVEPVAEFLEALGGEPEQVLQARDLVVVYSSENEILDLQPDLTALAQFDTLGVVVTAPGKKHDFVSRFFAPSAGVPEDPVTGSAHCELAPYWADRLGKTELRARQLSKRGGEVGCKLVGDRVLLSGTAVTLMHTTIRL